MTTETDAGGISEPVADRTAPRPSLFARMKTLFTNEPRGELVNPGSVPLALNQPVRIAWAPQPFCLKLGNEALEFHPDLPITGEESPETAREWIVHRGREFYDDVPNFVRIPAGEPILFGRSDSPQMRMFAFGRSVAERHVQISNRKGELTILPLDFERSTEISALQSTDTVWARRRENLARLPDLLGHQLIEFDEKEALAAIRNVNGIMAKEAFRELNDDGAPGGIIQFPDDMTVVLLGDIHARTDNLLRVITEGGLLQALEQDKACLVLLGDMVHSQETDELDDMNSSVFVLDLFCMLKQRFPANIFYIHGNHESFSPEVGKGGVPQGVVFSKYLKERRGKSYVTEVEALFAGLAFVVQGNAFAACHGAPVRSRVNRNTLVNIQRYPGIQHELVWNRLRQGSRPAGYSKGSIKRFRRTLNLPKHAPLIVGHTPQSTTETLWLNAGDIRGHHIVYSAHTHRLAAIVMRGGQLTPLEFIPENVLPLLNNEADP